MSAEIFGTEEELSERNFESIELRDGVVENRVFENCVFTRAHLSGSSFRRCRFVDCVFEECDLSNWQLAGAEMRAVTFKDCKMVGINWAHTGSLVHLDWNSCVLSYGNFVGLDLRKSSMRKCVAREADFADANLSEMDLRGTDFGAARFANTNLTKADLRQAMNYSIRPDSNKIKKAKFSLPEATLLLYGLDIVLED
jgi:uncharacterized protein YjbI with pentapeptide repeats